MLNSKRLFILTVVGFAFVNALTNNVTIYKMTVQNYQDIANITDSIWMIELKLNSSLPSEDFKTAAKVFNGIVKAGFINCGTGNCEQFRSTKEDKLSEGKIVFYYNNILVNDFVRDQSIIEVAINNIISHKINMQKEQLNQRNVIII